MSDSPRIPTHVAIIMDGNGRWAHSHDLPPIEGHKRGADIAQAITKKAAEIGISYLTLYTFSSENWNRSQNWVKDFIDLLRHYLLTGLKDLLKDNVRFRFIGDFSRFPEDVRSLIHEIEVKTRDLSGPLTVILALSYSGRDEIIRAVNKIICQKNQDHEFSLTPDIFSSYLDTKGAPDPDLLIRTSGEQRISNFLLWQCAYTEFVFSDKLWPDYTSQDFLDAILMYQKRSRRYGLSPVAH